MSISNGPYHIHSSHTKIPIMHCSACCAINLSTYPHRHNVSVLISVQHKWCKGMKWWNLFERLTCNLSCCRFCSAIRKFSTAARAAVHILISAVHSIFCSQCFSDISVQKWTLELLVRGELSDGADRTVVWRPTPRKILLKPVSRQAAPCGQQRNGHMTLSRRSYRCRSHLD